jgi:hypothetical protein
MAESLLLHCCNPDAGRHLAVNVCHTCGTLKPCRCVLTSTTVGSLSHKIQASSTNRGRSHPPPAGAHHRPPAPLPALQHIRSRACTVTIRASGCPTAHTPQAPSPHGEQPLPLHSAMSLLRQPGGALPWLLAGCEEIPPPKYCPFSTASGHISNIFARGHKGHGSQLQLRQERLPPAPRYQSPAFPQHQFGTISTTLHVPTYVLACHTPPNTAPA